MDKPVTKKTSVHVLPVESMVLALHASTNCRLFMQCQALVDGENTEVLQNGRLSCAFFVTSILTLFGFLNGIQLTVHRAIDALYKFGWGSLSETGIIPGCVIVWKENKINGKSRKHIGIYIGSGGAISNDGDLGYPASHDYREYKGRGIETILYHPKLQADRLLCELAKRQKTNADIKHVNNGCLRAGSPMFYYCQSCGEEMIFPENKVPKDVSHCKNCDVLMGLNLL